VGKLTEVQRKNMEFDEMDLKFAMLEDLSLEGLEEKIY
jgi:hypothetical protein